MILEPLTNQQKHIPNFLYKFRFINTNQFQKLFNHKEPNTVQDWLKDLKDKGYIVSMYTRKVRGENTWHLKPVIY